MGPSRSTASGSSHGSACWTRGPVVTKGRLDRDSFFVSQPGFGHEVLPLLLRDLVLGADVSKQTLPRRAFVRILSCRQEHNILTA